MATKPLILWKQTCAKGTTNRVSYFFEQLAQRILRGKTPAIGDVDLVVYNTDIGGEIKGGDNNHPLRIPVVQFERHKEDTESFPGVYSDLLYFLFCYRNKGGSGSGKRRSLLAKCRSEIGVYELLARQTDTLYVFDYRILEAIRTMNGVGQGKFPCGFDQEVIELRRGLLSSFNPANAAQILPYLGFALEEWEIRERLARVLIKIGFFDHQLELKIIEVLPKELMPRLDRAAGVPRRSTPMRRTMRLSSAARIASASAR